MSEVGEVYRAFYRVAVVLKRASNEVGKQVGAQVSDVNMVVDGRTTRVHGDRVVLKGSEALLFSRGGVKEIEGSRRSLRLFLKESKHHSIVADRGGCKKPDGFLRPLAEPQHLEKPASWPERRATIEYMEEREGEEKDVDIAELAQQVTYRAKDRLVRFRALGLSERSAVFNVLSAHVRQEILKQLSLDETVELLDHLDLRRTHQILAGMKNDARRAKIIKRLKSDRYSKIEYFLQFHPRATIGLFNINYVLLPDNTSVGETANVIEDHLHNNGKIPEVLVSKNGEVVGDVSLGTLVRERNTSKISSFVRPIQSVVYNSARQDVVSLFTSHPHKKVAILDIDGSVLGVVYSDDVIDLIGESPAATLYSFAGVEESERPFDGVWSKVQHPYKWLILNLATSFLAAGVVAFYNETLAQVVLLAIYMPIIAGMGGNAATQTLAVMVRGIAIGEISLKNSKAAIMREVMAGLANGFITGTLVAMIAIVFNRDLLFGIVIGLSVMVSLVVAGFFGAFIPLLLRRFGKDPATSATIFITTATDVLGFMALLGLATAVLL